MFQWLDSPDKEEVEQYAHSSLLKFHRWAPQRSGLTATDQLGPILVYLRKCCKSTIRDAMRNASVRQPVLSLENYLDLGTSDQEQAWVELREMVGRILERLLETENERLICFLRFECNIPPREIVDAYPDRFSLTEVNNTVQRLTRRMRTDPEMQRVAETLRQNSIHFASLNAAERFDLKRESSMAEPCPLQEVDLLDYVTGVAMLEIQRSIEASPVCQQAAEALTDSVGPLLALLYRRTCPPTEMLVDYQEHLLRGGPELIVHRHVERCPLCRQELSVMQQMDSLPDADRGSFFRRLVEAILYIPGPLAQPVRGDTYRYQAPHVHLHISLHHHADMPRRWTVRGQVRSPQGLLIGDEVEGILLIPLSEGDEAEKQVEWSENRRTFAFTQVPAGLYQLRLLMTEEEIVIRKIMIGDTE